MSSLPISPELEEILRDIANDPNATAFTVRPEHLTARVRGENFRIGIAMPGLTTAERELVRAHRAETAWLLREAYRLSILADPDLRSIRRVRGRALSRDGLIARAAEVHDRVPSTQIDPNLADLIAAGGILSGSGRIAALESASQLDPSPSSRIYLAQALADAGAPARSRALLADLLTSSSDAGVRAYTHQALAHTLELLGEYSRGLEHLSLARSSASKAGLGSDFQVRCWLGQVWQSALLDCDTEIERVLRDEAALALRFDEVGRGVVDFWRRSKPTELARAADGLARVRRGALSVNVETERLLNAIA